MSDGTGSGPEGEITSGVPGQPIDSEKPKAEVNQDLEVQDAQSETSKKEERYEDILQKQAYSLLAQYLPEALPQESTEVIIQPGSISSAYITKYRGKHYILLEDLKYQRRMDQLSKYTVYTNGKRIVPPEEPGDWDETERLAQGVNQYSLDSWKNVYSLVHELIHQKQAELHPSSFYTIPDSEPFSLRKLQDKYLESIDPKSLWHPVMEGMAVLGSYYVMSRFLADLDKSGMTEVAAKVRKIRDSETHLFLQGHDNKYAQGFILMRKLSKQFGLENTPNVLAKIDIEACKSITSNSSQYQQIMENPSLLPGLQTSLPDS